MYKPLRVALKSLWREFKRASFLYPSLYHELIFSWEPISLPKKTWNAFIDAALKRDTKPSWESFEAFPNLKCCGRYFGNEAGLEEVERLGESLYLVLCELDPALDREEGHFGFLRVLDEMAFNYPTPLLRVQLGVWGKAFESSPDSSDDKSDLDYLNWFEEQVSRWTTPENGGESYPSDPYCRTLVQNVFTSAIGAIQNILNPDNALLVGDKYDDLPFALKSERGVARISETVSESAVQVSQVRDLPQLEEPDKVEKPPYQFQLIGDVWLIRFETEEGYFQNLEGFRHIAKLLASPEKQIEALEFQGHQDSPVANAALTVQLGLEKEDVAIVEKELTRLKNELAQENKAGNDDRLRKLQEEIQKGEKYLKEGRNRRLGSPSTREKDRKAVSGTIQRAKQKLKPKMPEFAKFLDRSILANDASFAYCSPSPAPKWVL